MTERQGSLKDMASVSIRTRRRPSAPWGTWMGESLVVGPSVLTMQQVRRTKKNWKVRNWFQRCRYSGFCVMLKSSAVLVCCVVGLGTGSPIIESPYGDSVQPQEAPESISRAVASLPPEQMFELMKQMKVTIMYRHLVCLMVSVINFYSSFCPALCPEQPTGGKKHAAAEPSAGLCSVAGPGGHAHCGPRNCLGNRC